MDSRTLGHSEAADLRAAFDRGEPSAEANIRAALSRYSFYHSIEAAPGIRTEGIKWIVPYQENFNAATAAIDFNGKRVLDVGCRDGAMLFTAEDRGAAELVGVDNDCSPGLTEFLIPFRRSKIVSIERNIYDISPADLGRFDIVISCGLLYHLKFPILGIRRLADMLSENGVLILETALIDYFDDLPILLYPRGPESFFDATSPAFFNLAALANAFEANGLTPPQILRQFNRRKQKLRDRFPRFARRWLSPRRIPTVRTILTARRAAPRPDDIVEQYFEGTHAIHKSGRDVTRGDKPRINLEHEQHSMVASGRVGDDD